MVNKVYILASLIAASASGCCMYYCICTTKNKEEVTTIVDDIPQEDEPIPTPPQNSDDKEEECDKINCNEPLRASKQLLAVIGPKDGDECIYNICELVTLLDAYLSSHNLMTHRVVTINYPLAKLVDFQKYDTIEYPVLLNTLLERHTSKF